MLLSQLCYALSLELFPVASLHDKEAIIQFKNSSSMWPKFIDIEAQYLLRILNQSPTLIITRAKVTSVHGMSICP